MNNQGTEVEHEQLLTHDIAATALRATLQTSLGKYRRQRLEGCLGRPGDTINVPVGGSFKFVQAVLQEARETVNFSEIGPGVTLTPKNICQIYNAASRLAAGVIDMFRGDKILVTTDQFLPLPGTGAFGQQIGTSTFKMRVIISYDPATLAQRVTLSLLFGVVSMENPRIVELKAELSDLHKRIEDLEKDLA